MHRHHCKTLKTGSEANPHMFCARPEQNILKMRSAQQALGVVLLQLASRKNHQQKPHHKLSYLRRNYYFTAQRSLKRDIRAIKSMSCFMSGTISQGSRQAPRTIFPHLCLAPCNPLLSVYLSRFPSFCLLMVPACCCLSRLHTGVIIDVTL